MTDTEILKSIACANTNHFIGSRPGRASRYAVLDIDAGSRYHNLESLKTIQALLDQAGIAETNLYRSSASGGWHLYIFFDTPISSADLRNQLYQLLRLHDFEIAKGTLEIFPHPGQNSSGQGLRLPLQLGFAWINDDTLSVRQEREELSPEEALLQFLSDMECSVNSAHQFHQLKAFVSKEASTREAPVARAANATHLAKVIPIRNSVSLDVSDNDAAIVQAVFQGLPPGIISDVWLRGRNYYYHGLTGPAQRADAIYSLSHYLFYGDPEKLISAMGYGYESERKWMIEEVLKTKHHGFSKDLTKGRGDSFKQVERAANWVPPARRGQDGVKYEAVVPLSWKLNSANLKNKARKVIAAAVADFEEAGMSFSVRDLMLKSCCSSNTLYNHQDLWKEAQQRLQSGLLANDLGVYNAGEVAACSQSELSSSADRIFDSSGTLVDCITVYDLHMRSVEQDSCDVVVARRAVEASEDLCRDGLLGLLQKDPGKLSAKQLQTRINFLVRELLIVQCQEDSKLVQEQLKTLLLVLFSRGPCVQVPISLSKEYQDLFDQGEFDFRSDGDARAG